MRSVESRQGICEGEFGQGEARFRGRAERRGWKPCNGREDGRPDTQLSGELETRREVCAREERKEEEEETRDSGVNQKGLVISAVGVRIRESTGNN